MRIIGLTGLAGSGKTTVAHYLEHHCGYERMKFASILKGMLRVLGLTEEEIEGSKKELPCELLGGKSPRHAMITLGTEWGRNLIDSDLWVRAAMKGLESTHKDMDDQRFVFDDVRFPNEAQAIKDRGGVIWRIERPSRSWMGHVSHESEAGQSRLEADSILFNTGSKLDLPRAVLDILAGSHY